MKNSESTTTHRTTSGRFVEAQIKTEHSHSATSRSSGSQRTVAASSEAKEVRVLVIPMHSKRSPSDTSP